MPSYMIRKAILRNKPFQIKRVTLVNFKMLSSDTFRSAKGRCFQQAIKQPGGKRKRYTAIGWWGNCSSEGHPHLGRKL